MKCKLKLVPMIVAARRARKDVRCGGTAGSARVDGRARREIQWGKGRVQDSEMRVGGGANRWRKQGSRTT